MQSERTNDSRDCFSSLLLRPDYKKLNVLKIQFPDVPILAVTATATEKVARDCQQILKIQGCQQFKCSFNR